MDSAIGIMVIPTIIFLIWFSFHVGWTLHKNWNAHHTVHKDLLVNVGYSHKDEKGETRLCVNKSKIAACGADKRNLYILLSEE